MRKEERLERCRLGFQTRRTCARRQQASFHLIAMLLRSLCLYLFAPFYSYFGGDQRAETERLLQFKHCTAHPRNFFDNDTFVVHTHDPLPKKSDLFVYRRNDIVSNSILRTGSWDKEQIQTLDRLMDAYAKELGLSKKDLTFVDVGANIGAYSIPLAQAGYRVVAFEPMPQNVEALRTSICLNKVEENATLFTHALGAKRQQCIAYSDDGNIGDGHVSCSDGFVPPKGYSVRAEINVKLLDDYLDYLRSRTLGAMKIDVEGYEANVVEGGLLALCSLKTPYIQLELHIEMIREKGGSAEAMLNRFKECGYSIQEGGFDGKPIKDIGELLKRGGIKQIFFKHHSV